VITCRKCGKENQDHYKFCLGCGAELPRETAPKPFTPDTPPQGVPAVTRQPQPPALPLGGTVAVNAMPGLAGMMPAPVPTNAPGPRPASNPPAAVVAAPPAAASPAGADDGIACPQCQHQNPYSNRFCAGCGYNLGALQQMAQPAAPMPAAAQPAASVSTVRPMVLVALRADGSEAGRFQMPDVAVVTVGRDTGSIFAGDSYLSPRHAAITRRGNDVMVKDAGSLNGVYLKLRPQEPWPLDFGDIFRIGQEIIRFDDLVQQPLSADGVRRFGSPAKGYVGRLALVIGRDTTGNAFPVPERGIHCGRERGDILFSEDGYVSGLHCRVARGSDGRIALTDVGSSNGTFVRLKGEHALYSGAVLLMGQQLFRVDY
jgi:pSer/pThr/pTyr-binding forkhead associated (FHA) protein